MPGASRLLTIAYAVFLFGVAAYFVPAATWNPVSRFDLTRAIVEGRTLSIDRFVENTGDRSFRGGHWYTDKAPIPSLLAVPTYAAFHAVESRRGHRPEYSVFSTRETPALRVTVNRAFEQGLYVASLSTAGLGMAVLGVLLFRVLERRTTRLGALFGSAGVALATPLLPYSTSFYGHGVAAAFLTGAWAALFEDPDSPPSTARIRVAGACIALAAGSEYLALLPGAALALTFLASRPRAAWLSGAMDLALGAVAPASVVALYHTVCFGAPHHTGYSFLVRPEFAAGHASGLMGLHLPTRAGLHGLLLSQNRGLFVLAPVALPALIGLADLARRDAAARAALAAFVVLLLANAGYYMWWGGAAAGPRHLVPAMPFLALGLSRLWDGPFRWVAALLALVSFANVLVLTAVGLEAPDRGSLLFDYAYARFLRGELASLSGAENLGIRLGLARGASLGPILVWVLLGGRFLVRLALEPEDTGAEPDSAEVAPSAPA
ncbi:MAG TPA: hypothetical protein VHE30_15550 [Polyangiaceae bacterium]|nr:hypothetical protein [Polyangiaceae bacterium]